TATRDHAFRHRANSSFAESRRQASAAPASPCALSHSAGQAASWAAMSSATRTRASRPAIPTKPRATGPRPRLRRRRPSGEVEQDGDQGLLAEVHQMADLEHLEGALAETVSCRVEEPAERAGKRVGAEAVAELVVLQGVDEVREAPRRALAEQLEGPGQGLPLSRGDRHALERQEPLEPLLGPHALREALELRERIERERA